MPNTRSLPIAAQRPRERGIALLLVLLICALLYIVVADIVTRSEFDAMTSQNFAVESRMREAMQIALADALQAIADDAEAAEGGGEAGADLGGALGGVLGGSPAGAEGGEGGEEAAPPGDSSRDGWFRPASYFDDNEVTVYAFIEDENRKFNLLSLLSEDGEFAERSRDRLVRLIDVLWEDTPEDVNRGDAELWARAIEDWMKGANRSDERPRIPLATNGPGSEITIPLDLDELRMLPEIPEEVWDDRIIGRQVRRGLSAVLTVHTSLVGTGTGEEGSAGPGSDTTGGVSAAGGSEAESLDPESPPPLGPGVRVNVNTAVPAVLRSLENEADLPRRIVDDLLRHRNEIDEDAQAQAEEEARDSATYTYEETTDEQFKVFESVDALEEVESWKSFPQNEAKERFQAMLTTSSHVFTVHLAAVYKRDAEGQSYLVQRSRGVFVRVQDGEKTILQPLVPMRRTDKLRLFLPDFPLEEEERDPYAEMTDFQAEEELWNPFFLDFYDPEKRNERR